MTRNATLSLLLFALSQAVWSASQVELDSARNKAAAWLVRNQLGDGRWTALSGGLDIQVTATAIEALVESGFRSLPQVASGVAWLQNVEASSVDALARQVHALAAAGATDSAKRLAKRLEAAQDVATGMWGAYVGYLPSIPDTPLSLLALKRAEVVVANEIGVRTAIENGRGKFSSGISVWWPNFRISEERYISSPLTSTPGVTPTAYIVGAMHAFGWSADIKGQGVEFIRQSQIQTGESAGGFIGGSGNVSVWETVVAAEVLAAISAQGRDDPGVQLSLDLLQRIQGEDGSWSGDGFSTAHALKLIGAGSSIPIDSDQDGVADVLENILGTDSSYADSKLIRITGHDDGDRNWAYRFLRGRPVSEVLPINEIASCCTAISGALPSGLSLNTSGTPLVAKLGGVPAQSGYYDVEFGYRDVFGVDRRAILNLEVSSSLYRIDADPFPMSVLFGNPLINRLRTGVQFLVDDFNGDGRLDLVGYLNGYNERFVTPDCNPCAYDGPDWGLIIGLQGIGSSYAYVNGVASVTQIPGDVRSMHVLDFNNDGRRDILFVLNRVETSSSASDDLSVRPFRPLVLMRNDSVASGNIKYTDVTDSMGLDAATEGFVVVADGNMDGIPDFVVSNGVSPARYFQFDSISGKYVDRSAQSGLGTMGMAVGLNLDPEAGNTVDIATVSASHGLRFYFNNGNGTFSLVDNISSLSSISTNRTSRMAVGDVNSDQRQDIVLFQSGVAGNGAASNWAGSIVTVLENSGNLNGRPSFETWPASVLTSASGSSQESNLGGTVVDVDSDGRQDIIVASRDISSSIASNVVFRQYSDGSFDRLAIETGFPAGVTGFDSPVPIDLNGDASVDLVFPNTSNTAYRLINEGATGRSLTVILKGNVANRFALGARVRVIAGGRVFEQQLLVNHANTPWLHFGLGEVDAATVEVHWPDGSLQTIQVTDLDRRVTVTQP